MSNYNEDEYDDIEFGEGIDSDEGDYDEEIESDEGVECSIKDLLQIVVDCGASDLKKNELNYIKKIIKRL